MEEPGLLGRNRDVGPQVGTLEVPLWARLHLRVARFLASKGYI